MDDEDLRGRIPALEQAYGAPLVLLFARRRLGDAVLELLDTGADLNAQGRDGETLLQEAVEQELEAVVARLLDGGVDPNATHADSTPTALYRAARVRSIRLVTLLLQRGALPDALSYARETPLMIAASLGHLEIAELLIAAGACVNAASSSGWTPLMHAGMGGHVAMAELLLRHGASAEATDKDGYNATDLARAHRSGAVAQGFRNLGIRDHYMLQGPLRDEYRAAFDIFISYAHRQFLQDADLLRDELLRRRHRVFVDRHVLALKPGVAVDAEQLRQQLAGALSGTRLTVFFEMPNDRGFEYLPDGQKGINWQYFELLHSKAVVLVSPSDRCYQDLTLIPGEHLKTGLRTGFKDYAELSDVLTGRM